MFRLDLRKKEKVTVYLSDNPKRISHAQKVIPLSKQDNETCFFVNCDSLTNLARIEKLEIDKLIIDYREPMKSIANKLSRGNKSKIVDDREYNLSDTYEDDPQEDKYKCLALYAKNVVR